MPDKRLFGRWAPRAISGTTEEIAHFRTSVDEFMHGRAQDAQFILRGVGVESIGGQQVVYQMTIKGLETLTIDGAPVETVKMRINYTFGGNNATWWVELWFDPATNLWVKSVASLELGPEFTWSVDHIFIKKPEA